MPMREARSHQCDHLNGGQPLEGSCMGPATSWSNAMAGAHDKPAARRNTEHFVKPGAFITFIDHPQVILDRTTIWLTVIPSSTRTRHIGGHRAITYACRWWGEPIETPVVQNQRPGFNMFNSSMPANICKPAKPKCRRKTRWTTLVWKNAVENKNCDKN